MEIEILPPEFVLLSDKGFDELHKLLGKSRQTTNFAYAAEGALKVYREIKKAKFGLLSDTQLTDPRNGKFTKISNYSSKLLKELSSLPSEQWRLINTTLPVDQPEMVKLLQKLIDETIGAIEYCRPEKVGNKNKMENWAFIEILADSFSQSFPQHQVTEARSSLFYKAVKTIFDRGSGISIADPRDMIKAFLESSPRWKKTRINTEKISN